MKALVYSLVLSVFLSCNSNTSTQTSKPDNSNSQAKPKQRKQHATIQLTSDKQTGTVGDKFKLKFESHPNTIPDSVKLSENNLDKRKINFERNSILWDSKTAKTGTNQVRITLYWGDTLVASKALTFKLKSDITPELYGFKIKNTFDHSYKNYTQGFEYKDGYLYEGTGQYGESMLFKTDIDKNEIIHSLNLPDDVFGEGITLLNDKIYQLTWRSSIGFVYDKQTFKKLYDFSYPTEGWGLTNNGKELIMSDGSENIYFLDTEFMQETRKLQVYDHKGPVTDLNELELIDDLVYANIYGSEEIVAIDVKTGKVIKRIDLSGILDKKSIKHPIDVLNGIAWDKEGKRLLVTGKWWPNIFEIELIKK